MIDVTHGNVYPDSVWALIEQRIIEFESAWQHHPIPDLDQFAHLNVQNESQLKNDASGSRVENEHTRQLQLLNELVKVDIEFQWKSGHRALTETYFQRYPELSQQPIAQQIIEAEFDARRIVNDLPDESEICRRFPDSAEHWKARVEQMRITASKTLCSAAATNKIPHKYVVGGKKHFQPGDRIGHFELKEKIGQGSFAEVWKSLDHRLKRVVAIKLLHAESGRQDEAFLQRLVREGHAVAAINHPGVVKIYEVSDLNQFDCPFIVEQYVDGKNLKDALSLQTFSQERAAEIMLDVSNAAHAAHTSGVVHRDIKPANILLAEKNPVLVDFGLAQLDLANDATLTRHGELLGTPAYMSPEQALGNQQIDARSDVYSLGAVLYHLLAKSPPFLGPLLSVLDDAVRKLPSRTGLACHGVHRDLETIVFKCMEKDPGDRYTTAAELASDLQRFLNGVPITARPVGRLEQSWKWARRHPRWAAAAVVVFALAAFSLGTLLQLNSVTAQRSRAELAEARAQQLLMESTRSAGRLAMQRGKPTEAVNFFQQARKLNPAQDPILELDLAESLIASRQIDDARQVLQHLNVKDLPPALAGNSLVLTGQIELETGNSLAAIPYFEQAIENSLSPGLAAYARAMLVDNSPAAILELRRALEFDPLSYLPRRMMITLLLSLAQFEEAADQLEVAQQLFPDDVDFLLLDGIRLAATGQLETANESIAACSLNTEQKNQWQDFYEGIRDFQTTNYHRDNDLGFNQASLVSLRNLFVDTAYPCLSDRGYQLPPKVSIEFSEFFQRFSTIGTQGFNPGFAWPQMNELVQVHPEGSLIVLYLSTLLSQDKTAEALAISQTIPRASGYVRDSDELLAEIQFTSALVELTSTKGEAERNQTLKAGTEAIIRFPEHINLMRRYSSNCEYCRLVCYFLVESFKSGNASESLTNTWLDRLVEHPENELAASTWMKAVVANRSRRPYDALRLLTKMQRYVDGLTPAQQQGHVANVRALQRSIESELKRHLELSQSSQWQPAPDAQSPK